MSCRRHRWNWDLVCLTCGRIADPRFHHARTAESRFWSKVDTSGQCWEWQGQRTTNGYGRFSWGGSMLAHRAVWELSVGSIPAGYVVMHKCDNPPCVRPEHLALGTMADNQADMARKGRAASGDRNGARKYPDRLRGRPGPRILGEANGQAKITAEIARAIRASSDSGRDVAARYGLSTAQVSRIRSGQRWAHV